MNTTINLNGCYKLKSFPYEQNTDFILAKDFIPVGWLSTHVPEDIRTALRREGLITGHYYGKELDCERFIEEKNWVYHRRFSVDTSIAKKRNILRFEGIDTLAEIYLNGEKLGFCQNMFISQEFDISKYLKYGKNETNILVIKVISPIFSIAEVDRTELYPPEDTGRLLLRKSQMNYGWDFCGHCLTGGIWKNVTIESIDTDFISDVFLDTKAIGDTAVISASVEVTSGVDTVLADSIAVSLYENGVQAARTEIKIAQLEAGSKVCVDGEIILDSPQLWWPRPYGEPFLYEVETVLVKDNEIIDSRRSRFGVRTVELIQEPLPKPDSGRSFWLTVNGRRLFVRGANWVPINCVYGEIKDSDYDPYIRRAVDANLSMLRIWGGGIYESEHFFNLCDENGIMVMQDFMLACGVLPQDDAFLAQVEEEAEKIARLYRPHTSLVVWSGDNELDEAYRWYDILPRFKENKVNRVAVKNGVKKGDPSRPFLVSSPCSPFDGEEGEDDPNSPLQGDMHIYLTRFHKESEHYYRRLREFVPRFMSEYGFSSLPCMDTTEKFNFFDHPFDMSRNPWLGELDEFKPIIESGDTKALVWATQFTHAMGLKYGIEYMRCHKWICSGLLYWKFNDPIAPNRENMLFPSLMSSVDFFGMPKSVYYYSRRAYEDVILAFCEDADDTVSVCFCNETLQSYSGELTLSLCSFDGGVTLLMQKKAVIGADISAVLHRFPAEILAPYKKTGYIKAQFSGEIELVNRFMPAEIREWFHIELPKAEIEATLTKNGNTLCVTLFTKGYAQDVTLEVIDTNSYYSDNCFVMDAGETREVFLYMDDPEIYENRCLCIKAQNSEASVFDLNQYLGRV